MNEITLPDLFTEDQIQEITAKFAEGQKEPEWYQIVRDAYCNADTTRHSDLAWFIRDELGIPIVPPEVKRPGVGVMMGGGGKYQYLILYSTDKETVYVMNDGTFSGPRNVTWEGHRPAIPEEITAFFHPGIDINDPDYTEKMAEEVMEEMAYVDNASELGKQLFPVIEKAIDGEELISTKLKDQVEDEA